MVCPCALGSLRGGSRKKRGSRKQRAGYYKATKKNRQLLRRYKRGNSIGFTAKASLKAKGLLPRTSGEYRGVYVLGPKYSGTGRPLILTKRRRS